MARISGFADEVSKELSEQIDGLKAAGIGHIALRGCWGKNVMDWTDAESGRIKSALDAAGVGVSEIGSPVGKTPIDEPFEKTAEALAHAVRLAKRFETPNIRMFSFYPPKQGGPGRAAIGDFRDEVLGRLGAMARQVANEPVVLMLENESELYGDYPKECLDIFRNVQAPAGKLRMAFDFANFISRQFIDVYEDAWRPLKGYVGHVHVKDWVPAKGGRPAGEGVGQLKAVFKELAADGYAGFMTLEPHLAKAERFSGFSGLDKFKAAAEALFRMCREVGLATE